jgi:sulfide:quinone oxidoreductase
VAHFESETLADNILLHIKGEPLKEEFDGHSNCFIESGNGKACSSTSTTSTSRTKGISPLPSAP